MKKIKVGIIGGTGMMGQIFKNIFENANCSVFISGRKTKFSHEDCVKKSDVVVFTVPILETKKTIERLIKFTNKSQLLLDLTSLKMIPIDAMMKSDASVIGMHPVFGPMENIFQKNIILVPSRPGTWLDFVKKVMKKSNLRVSKMTAKKHDKMMAIVQAFSHFSDLVFGNILSNSKFCLEELSVAFSPLFEEKVRIMKRFFTQDPTLAMDIEFLNPFFEKVLEKYKNDFEKIKKIIDKKDKQKYKDFFMSGKPFFEIKKKDVQSIKNEKITNVIKKTKIDKNKILVFGKEFSWTDIATKHAKEKLKLKELVSKNIVYQNSFKKIFKNVKNNIVDVAILPFENSINGFVVGVLDELVSAKDIIFTNLWKLDIDHVLVVKNKNEKIKKIYSHSQSFGQCAVFLNKNFENTEKIYCSDNASAGLQVFKSEENGNAVICSKKLAKKFGFIVLHENISDFKNNKTSFILIKKKSKEIKRNLKNFFIIFSLENKPKSLFFIFEEFAKKEINITKIESRPSRKEIGKYIFFLEFENNTEEKKIKNLFNNLKKKTYDFRIVGFF